MLCTHEVALAVKTNLQENNSKYVKNAAESFGG
jgi:hypothetical protein